MQSRKRGASLSSDFSAISPPQKKFRRSQSALTLAQTKAVDREVRKIINQKTDYKYTDFIQSSSSIDFSGTMFNLLQNCVRGDLGKDNFDGDTLTPKWLQVRWIVNAATAQSFNGMRIIIGQSNVNGVPTPQNILENLGQAASVLSPRFESRTKDYKILYDRLITVDPVTNYTMNDVVFIPGRKLKQIQWTSTSATLALQKGCIFLLAISDDGLTDFPDLTFYSRIKYSN